jgi:hypothetical protein
LTTRLQVLLPDDEIAEIPGTRETYVNLAGQRARPLMVLQNFAAFAAHGR